MATVAAGSRLVLHSASGARVVRALHDVVLVDGCRIPVLGDVAAVDGQEGIVEVPTDRGALTVRAVLDGHGAGLSLRPLDSWGTVAVQRRGDMRSAVALPVRAAFLPDGPLCGPPAPLARDGARAADVEGATLDASGGGLAVQLRQPARLSPGARLYVEIDLPDGVLAPAVAVVVAQRGTVFRARFHDITLRDRERLVRAVFARHRADLAGRRRALDGGLT
jgi:hypothetical protein